MSDLLISPLHDLERPYESTAREVAGTVRYRALAATNDVDAVRAWLALTLPVSATFNNCRKEAERFLLWARLVCGKTLVQLTFEDFQRFRLFLADPQPREDWVAEGGRKYGRQDPRWKPFYGTLSPNSQRQALLVVNSLMSWLVEAGYLPGNPLALSKKRTSRPLPRVTRYLTPGLWEDLKAYVEALPRITPAEGALYHRARWLFSLLYLGALRLSEVTGTTMGQFRPRRDSHGEDRWWLEVKGKGGKVREVPVTQDFLAELVRYRREQGLPDLPQDGELTPMVLPLRRTGRPLTRSALHTALKQLFEGAAQAIMAQSPANAARAKVLRQASAHWLRHTAGSHMADNQVDLRVVRDNFGHATLATTSLYLHTDDDRRHAETDQKHKLGW